MKISTQWLKQYVDYTLGIEQLAQQLTMAGFEVEDISYTESAWEGVVVGKIADIVRHPNAEKLHLCQVEVGENEKIQVICGAPNAAVGLLAPFARAGATLPHGKVDTVTIRGVRSEGMLCSEKELGLSDDHSGILVLSDTLYRPGDTFRDSRNSSDAILEVNVTPNRPDCLSHIGIAREISALQDKPLKKPSVSLTESPAKTEEWIQIDIQDPISCPRYTARIISDVKIGPSPEWLRERLESVGIRSINNVVDVTNFILMESGQPLHAFDYDLIQGKKIIVRKAKQKETFVTLDGKEHSLTSEDLLIADTRRGIALAGVMGGTNSEVTEKSRNILLESAHFDPMTIRKTAKRAGLSTEASQRFERGADPECTVEAVNRAAQLIAECADGKILRNALDLYPGKKPPVVITLRPKRIREIIGKEVPRETVIRLFEKIGLDVNPDTFQVVVPGFRPDLVQEIDLIEEVIRLYGYDRVESRLLPEWMSSYRSDVKDSWTEWLRDTLAGFGFLEAQLNSLVPREYASLMHDAPVAVQNPLSPETSFLRTSLIPGLLDTVQLNRNRFLESVRLFEIGRVFFPNRPLPVEHLHTSGLLFGSLREHPFWNERPDSFTFFHIKGVVESLLEKSHVTQYRFTQDPHPLLDSETSLSLWVGESKVGYVGEIKDTLVKQWDLHKPVYVFELDAETLLAQTKKITASPVPKYPPVKRDLAFVLDEALFASEISSVIRKAAGDCLESVELFDLYRGDQIPSGKKSLAFSLTFRSREKTLKEEEIDPMIRTIVKTVSDTFSASLRS